jgi:hypothetical protein
LSLLVRVLIGEVFNPIKITCLSNSIIYMCNLNDIFDYSLGRKQKKFVTRGMK